MKNWIILLIFFASCKGLSTPEVKQSLSDTIIISKEVHDTIHISDKRKIDSLQTQLSILKFKIERVNYYLKICKHRPSQTKFLVSWIDRAIK